MNNMDGKKIGIAVGAGLLAIAIVNSAYQAGLSAGLARSGHPGVVVDHGFFPFPPFLLIVGLVLFVAWRKRWIGHGNGNGSGPIGRGPGGGRPPRLFEEWHQRAHEADARPMTPPAAPTGERSGNGPETAPAGVRPEGSGPETRML